MQASILLVFVDFALSTIAVVGSDVSVLTVLLSRVSFCFYISFYNCVSTHIYTVEYYDMDIYFPSRDVTLNLTLILHYYSFGQSSSLAIKDHMKCHEKKLELLPTKSLTPI
jgi:hypothetical protein